MGYTSCWAKSFLTELPLNEAHLWSLPGPLLYPFHAYQNRKKERKTERQTDRETGKQKATEKVFFLFVQKPAQVDANLKLKHVLNCFFFCLIDLNKIEYKLIITKIRAIFYVISFQI